MNPSKPPTCPYGKSVRNSEENRTAVYFHIFQSRIDIFAGIGNGVLKFVIAARFEI